MTLESDNASSGFDRAFDLDERGGRPVVALCNLIIAEALAANASAVREPPNKRLKLAGGDRSKGSGVLCPGEHELSFKYTARAGRVARSLSAIR